VVVVVVAWRERRRRLRRASRDAHSLCRGVAARCPASGPRDDWPPPHRPPARGPLFIMGATRKLQAEIDRTLKRVTEGLEVFEDIWEKVREEGEWGGWTTETAAARAAPAGAPAPPRPSLSSACVRRRARPPPAAASRAGSSRAVRRRRIAARPGARSGAAARLVGPCPSQLRRAGAARADASARERRARLRPDPSPLLSSLQVYDPDQAALREKNEADLKKELKKLQKHRDAVKAWLAGSDVKDKAPLAEARKAVERVMERFKVCEREAKTKAFSKEGLAKAKEDPRAAARSAAREWINASVARLVEETDAADAELESVGATGGRRKGRLPPRAATLAAAADRHRAHVARLEALLRLLDNEAVEADEVDAVRDLVDDYLERWADSAASPEEFADPDDLYPGLVDRLDAVEASLPSVPSVTGVKAKDGAAAGSASAAARAAAAAKQQLAAQGVLPSTPSAGGGGEEGRRPAAPATTAEAGAGASAAASPRAAPPAGWAAPPGGAVVAAGGGGGGGGSAPAAGSAPGSAATTPRAAAAAAPASTPPPPAPAAAPDAPPPTPAAAPAVLQALLAACAPRSIPTPADSAWAPVPPRARSLPRGAPASYPATRLPVLDNPALYERLDTEALFFAFYYMPGTHAQHLAARELKRQSWRYHKQHGAWFQRHEEPRAATDEFERVREERRGGGEGGEEGRRGGRRGSRAPPPPTPPPTPSHSTPSGHLRLL